MLYYYDVKRFAASSTSYNLDCLLAFTVYNFLFAFALSSIFGLLQDQFMFVVSNSVKLSIWDWDDLVGCHHRRRGILCPLVKLLWMIGELLTLLLVKIIAHFLTVDG